MRYTSPMLRPFREMLAVAALFATSGCHATSRGAPPPPITGAPKELFVMFIKHQTCKPSSCNDFDCTTFSDGITKGLPSHVVSCRWSDTTTSNPKRCAYLHYSVDAATDRTLNLYLSTPAFSDACQTDLEFAAILKDRERYSGAVP
ncbi:MAG: hypothetical protein JWM82_1977 [Myxococcales bacterium]|nr:hypothetical protein [Myxococcales bacterium]